MKAKQITQPVRDLVHARSGGMCELDGQRRAEEVHHRLGRQMGGSREPWINWAGNLLDLCSPCHRMVTNPRTGMTQTYRSRGWLVKRGLTRPSEVPVYMWHDAVLGWWLLDDDGGATRPTSDIGLAMHAAYEIPIDDGLAYPGGE